MLGVLLMLKKKLGSGKPRLKKINFKNSLFILLGVFVLIGILIFSLGKSGLMNSNEVISGINVQPVITRMPQDIPGNVYNPPEDVVLPTEEPAIDYDAILGLTQGNKYSKQLVGKNSKNILFIGTDKVSGLYDTIGILSIDKNDKKIKIIMLPRDLYVNYNLKVRHYIDLKASEMGHVNVNEYYKLNSAHTIGNYMKEEGKFGNYYTINFLAKVIEEKFDINISDFIRINTDGLVEVVDLFGGVSINVPYPMHYDDPFQDLEIHLEQGVQKLNGKQAEGFLRFRQGYDEEGNLKQYGDYERKKNQNTFIKAFIEQHGTVTNVNKIPGLLNSFSKNVKHSIGVGDILTSYLGTAKDAVVDKYSIESSTVTGKDKMINGLYYIVIDEDL